MFDNDHNLEPEYRQLPKLHKKFMFDNVPKLHKKFMFDNDHNLEPE